jgi:hypothetical protein
MEGLGMGPEHDRRAEALIRDAQELIDADLCYLEHVEELLVYAQAALFELKPAQRCSSSGAQRLASDLEAAIDAGVGWFDDLRSFRDEMSLVDAEAA